MESDAVILAPHPDDETLGCGGLIALKRDAGSEVTVVFLTDGAGSHPNAAALGEIRRREALSATSVLGVDESHVRFLDIADGKLESAVDVAVDLLEPILRDTGTRQLVLPHHLEPPSDHRIVSLIAHEATQRLGRPIPALLYPVWLWDQWPWTNPLAPPRARSSRRNMISITIRDRLGYNLTNELTHRVDIESVLNRKRVALDEHQTQMARIDDDPDWLTLIDICHGEWLDRLLQPVEYYAMTRFGDAGTSVR